MASEIPKGLQTQQSRIHFESPSTAVSRRSVSFFLDGTLRTRSHAIWLSRGFETSESRDTTVDWKDKTRTDNRQMLCGTLMEMLLRVRLKLFPRASTFPRFEFIANLHSNCAPDSSYNPWEQP